MAKRENLMKTLKKNYSVFQSTYNDRVYGVWKEKFNNFMGSVEEREDGVYFCPFDIDLGRFNEKIDNIEDFETQAQKYKAYWEEKGLNASVGDETFRHYYRLELALSLFLDNLCGKEMRKRSGMNNSREHETIVDGVSVIYSEGEDENTAEVCISLGGGRDVSRTFDNISRMLDFVGGVLGVMALEKVCPLLGAIDKLSKNGFMNKNVGDEIVHRLNLSTLDVEKCTLRDYVLDKLEEGIKALKGKTNG